VQDLTVAERIHNQFEDLTRAERQLANAMLENYPVSDLGRITAVAEASSVSPPTVVKLVRLTVAIFCSRYNANNVWYV
jgi:DNA-binding MurR/RpiR family transcriptional regulator